MNPFFYGDGGRIRGILREGDGNFVITAVMVRLLYKAVN